MEYVQLSLFGKMFPEPTGSHKGNDFRLVLESLARVSDPAVSIPSA